MSDFAPGEVFYCLMTTSHPATGAATSADALPTAAALRNGAVDAGFALTVAAVPGQTGAYTVSGTVPAGYAPGDRISVVATATVAGVTGNGRVAAFVVRSATLDAVDARLTAVRGQTDRLRFDAENRVLAVSDGGFDPDAALLDGGAGATFTWKQAMRLMFAFLVGERAGGGLAEKTFAAPGTAKVRVRMTTDANGNSIGAHTLDAGDA